MVKIPCESFEAVVRIVDYFTDEVGGCLNTSIDSDDGPFCLPETIRGGELDGFTGYYGHNPEKHISWTIATGGVSVYLETTPSSAEIAYLLELS